MNALLFSGISASRLVLTISTDSSLKASSTTTTTSRGSSMYHLSLQQRCGRRVVTGSCYFLSRMPVGLDIASARPSDEWAIDAQVREMEPSGGISVTREDIENA